MGVMALTLTSLCRRAMYVARAPDYTPESWWFTGKFAIILAAENGVPLDPKTRDIKLFLGLRAEVSSGAETPLPVSYLIARQAGRGLYIPLIPDWLIEP